MSLIQQVTAIQQLLKDLQAANSDTNFIKLVISCADIDFENMGRNISLFFDEQEAKYSTIKLRVTFPKESYRLKEAHHGRLDVDFKWSVTSSTTYGDLRKRVCHHIDPCWWEDTTPLEHINLKIKGRTTLVNLEDRVDAKQVELEAVPAAGATWHLPTLTVNQTYEGKTSEVEISPRWTVKRFGRSNDVFHGETKLQEDTDLYAYLTSFQEIPTLTLVKPLGTS